LDAVAALARKERVPQRIAKGELEGKMKCRIWRKLHAEEAKRFDQAYALVAAHPDVSLPEAFGVLQGGLTVEEFRARRERAQRRVEVKEARQKMVGDGVLALFQAWCESKRELSIVLGERTLIDVLEAEQAVALRLVRSGRVEKLKVVLVASRPVWDALAPQLDRDPRLVQRPSAVPREPERRPYSDPRLFSTEQGKEVHLLLRNGLRLQETLVAAGPFDLVLRSLEPDAGVLVPLHAVVRWENAPTPGQ
jgi:hypothetical protein